MKYLVRYELVPFVGPTGGYKCGLREILKLRELIHLLSTDILFISANTYLSCYKQLNGKILRLTTFEQAKSHKYSSQT
jgi:hypothetical protein